VVGVVEVLVLYYSRTGNVEAMARAVAEGVNSVEGASSRLRRVDYANVDDFVSCDAAAFGSPNYFGYMAGLMKDFFDRAWLVRERVSGKLAAAFTCGGSSSNAALLSLERMYSSFKLKKVSEGVAWGTGEQGAPSEHNLTACRKIGEALAKAAIEKKAKVPTG
jgi:multimeric flavodoxin WrbA